MFDKLSKNLNKLNDLTLEPWYDNISREIIENGTLKALKDVGIQGITSNPAIVSNSITSGNFYDQQIKELNSNDPEFVYWQCITQDIKNACEIMEDKFVSLEVSPKLWDDAKGTIEQAIELNEKVNKNNLMVKIPATPNCFEAITECLNQDLNINVTLIFSIDELKQAMEAVANAKSNKNVVFSFFVSRLDNYTTEFYNNDEQFKLASLYALKAYEFWQENKIENTKMLWASTSMKNPDFDPLYYVKNLVTPDSVNTMPQVVFDQMIENEYEFEQVTNYDKALLSSLESKIDLNKINESLKNDGLKAFIDSFNDGLENINNKL